MQLLIAVVSGFVLAIAAPALFRVVGGRLGYLCAALPLGIAVYFSGWIGQFEHGEAVVERYAWVPELGLSLSLRLDGLSLLFVLLICGIGTLVAVYSRGYFDNKPGVGRFYAYLLGFMAAMNGLVLAGNLLTLYVFWELTTLTSYFLIGFEHERRAARRAALQALLITALGGLAMLAGFLLLGHAAGSFELDVLLSRGGEITQHPHYPAILALILLGACTKSAQVPFHFWLPNAMQAPTPVSAYLHSATMVKAGIYLLARLLPVLGGTDPWYFALTAIGAATAFVGAYLAYFQHQLKALLAYLTIHVLGTLVLLLGIGTELAVKAALVYLVAHALYKAALFLAAGSLSHQTGTLDLRQLGGLRRSMPLTFTATALAALSMAGIVPLLGFVGKELYLESLWKAPVGGMSLTIVSVLASALLVAGAAIVGLRPYFGSAKPPADRVREASLPLWFGPLLLAAAGLAAGCFPQQLVAPLVEPAAANLLNGPVKVKLALWHGVTAPLLLSLTAVALGCVLYVMPREWLRPGAARRERLARFGSEAWYRRALAGLDWLGRWQVRVVQSGYLRLYVLTMLVVTALLVGLTATRIDTEQLKTAPLEVRFHEAVAAALVLVAAWTTVRSESRYRAVMSLGVIGLSVSWIYAMFGAPDLAITQIVVEALTVLLFVLAFQGLPEFVQLSNKRTRGRDAALAALVGGLTTVLLLAVQGPAASEQLEPISSYFARHSYELAHGRNVVNVILVDFRALDTLGEATVLATAAVGVYALLRLVLPKNGGDA